MEEKKTFIAVCDETWGVGESLEEAYVDLKKNSSSNYPPEPEDIVFYEAKELKVKVKFEIVYE